MNSTKNLQELIQTAEMKTVLKTVGDAVTNEVKFLMKCFEDSTGAKLTDRDKKIIRKFAQEGFDEEAQLREQWARKVERLMKRIQTQDKDVLKVFLSYQIFLLQHAATVMWAEILAAQGLMPIQTVEKLKEVIRND